MHGGKSDNEVSRLRREGTGSDAGHFLSLFAPPVTNNVRPAGRNDVVKFGKRDKTDQTAVRNLNRYLSALL